jgi:ElaB/YqjD/DUF883 family membrane-anchored ribosome-binding protein
MNETEKINNVNDDEVIEQSLMTVEPPVEETRERDYLGDFKVQAQEYQQKFNEVATKAKDYAAEKFNQASDKFKELQQKDPKELVEDAKEFARQKPGQTILISAAVGLVVGLILGAGRRR